MALSKSDLKFLLRSRSLSFMRNARFGNTGPLAALDWNGHRLHYRPGTSDAHLIYKILLRRGRRAEYVFPDALQAECIFDIGANIGAASLLLAQRFPHARIYSFEPVPDNFELLERNLAGFPNVTPVPFALARESGSRELILSADRLNRGGHSFFQRGAGADTPRIRVEAVTAAEFMRSRGLARVDLIKVDCEGAEYEVLSGFDTAVLREVNWIVGELHGENDFELLAYLSQWFDIEAKKSFGKPLFIFNACNKQALACIGR